MLDKAKVKYSHVSIIQASNLKEIFNELDVKRYEVTIVSVDAINMYHLIKLPKIKKVVRLFAIKITAATKKTINICLELMHFLMNSTLISFDGEYYEYHGGEKQEQGLAIGGYESAFLANLVTSYLVEKYKDILSPKTYHGLLNQTTYHIIYQYEGLVVFK